MRVLSQMSLTRQLTSMFVAAATVVLLMLGFVIASSVEEHFEELDLEVLSGKMALTRQALQSVTTQEGLLPFAHDLARSLVGHHGLEVMVLDADRAIVFATAHANFDLSLITNQAAQGVLRPELWTLDGKTYRGVVAQMPTAALDAAGHPLQVLVVAATDTAHHEVYMRSFLRTLWLFVTCAAALTGLLGWAAVRRGLAPLSTMREQAQSVTAQQLDQRLPVQSVPLELAQLAQSLNDMLARLEVAFARLSDFSSDIAHELRTPVSNLMTQTQVALSRPRDADDYRGVLESNAEELDRMARMVSDMLLLAKAENGLVVPNRETVKLTDEVRALFDYYEAVADEKQVKLVLEGNAEIQADRLMLRRALGNLLSNAVRHATPASRVQVTLTQTTAGSALRWKTPATPSHQNFWSACLTGFSGLT